MNKNILIIDDSESIRELVGASLEEANFSVHKAIDGQDGLDQLRGKDIDLIITDLNMPVMDGLTFVKEVRKKGEYQFTPILILTTELEAKKRQEAKELGATGWIVKPFDKEKLLKIINKIIR